MLNKDKGNRTYLYFMLNEDYNKISAISYIKLKNTYSYVTAN